MHRAVANAREQGRQPILICLGKVSQHKAGHRILMARMANSQTHAAIVCAQVSVDRAQPIMPRMATPLFEPQFPGG